MTVISVLVCFAISGKKKSWAPIRKEGLGNAWNSERMGSEGRADLVRGEAAGMIRDQIPDMTGMREDSQRPLGHWEAL